MNAVRTHKEKEVVMEEEIVVLSMSLEEATFLQSILGRHSDEYKSNVNYPDNNGTKKMMSDLFWVLDKARMDSPTCDKADKPYFEAVRKIKEDKLVKETD